MLVPGFVLHVDVDACFAQVEQLRDPSLQGKAVAVQQHQDIIAANHLAKAAGVAKHMAPAEARRLLAAVGGRVVHVYTAEGGRVSYKPYREMAIRMLKLLRSLPWARVVEKASIDECYVLLDPGPGAAAAFEDEADEEYVLGLAGVDAHAALQRAHEAKTAVLRELGLKVSVGAAPNRLVAKLASAAAKPDGVRLVVNQQEAVQLLAQTPACKLPGYGGRAASIFEQCDIRWATDLQRYSQHQLEQLLSIKEGAAAQLCQWCRGLDDTPVQDRGPAKTLSVQMSLTPQLLPMHPSQGHTVSASGGRAGVLEPLVTGKADFRLRVRQLMIAMGLDLLQRVQEDRAEENRWPRTLTASLRAFAAGRDHSFTARSSGFPALMLGTQAQRARQQAPQQQQQQREQQAAGGISGGTGVGGPGERQRDVPAERQLGAPKDHQRDVPGGRQLDAPAERQLDALEEAVVTALQQLVHQAAATYPPTATVVELRLAASSFESTADAPATAPISRFFAAVHKQKEQPQAQQHGQQQQQHGQQGQCEQPEAPQKQQQAGEEASPETGQRNQQQDQQQQPIQQPPPQHLPSQYGRQGTAESVPQHAQQHARQDPGPAAAAAAGSRPGSSCAGVDLQSIDIREQLRILQQIERQQQQQQHRPPPQQRSRAGDSSGSSSKKRSASKAASVADAKQPKISAFLKR